MELLLNKNKWFSYGNTSACGFIRCGDNFVRGTGLAQFFDSAGSFDNLTELLAGSNGQYSVVRTSGEETWLATDRLRTIPLFYHNGKRGSFISDSAITIAGEIENPQLNEEAVIPFLASGFTFNNQTLIRDIFQAEAGEIIRLNGQILKRSWFDYSSGKIAEGELISLSEELDEILNMIFRAYLTDLKESFIAIPLSGGFDSRLVAAMCRKYHPEKLLCYTYGRKDNIETGPAREVASRLGIPWINIVYDTKLMKGFTGDPVFRSYYPQVAELSSMFFMQEYFAVKYLHDNRIIPENSLFIPGFSGDGLAGGLLKPFMEGRMQADKISRQILHDFCNLKTLDPGEKSEIYRALEPKSGGKTPFSWLIYENWAIREKISKVIVNSANVFRFFGYDYVMPLWDNDLIRFFNCIPFRLKYNKKLYDYTLKNHIFSEHDLNLPGEINPTSAIRLKQRIKDSIKPLIPRSVVNRLIDYDCPVMTDYVAAELAEEEGKDKFSQPPQANRYNSWIAQWYLMKIRKELSEIPGKHEL